MNLNKFVGKPNTPEIWDEIQTEVETELNKYLREGEVTPTRFSPFIREYLFKQKLGRLAYQTYLNTKNIRITDK